MDWEILQSHMEGPFPRNLRQVLDLALTTGWDPSPITLAMRMSKSSYHPCFIVWELNPETMRYRFLGARTNLVREDFGGKLTLADLKLYLQNPDVIEREAKNDGPWTRREGV